MSRIFKIDSWKNEEKLIERMRQGDESALTFIYKRHYNMIKKLIIDNSGTIDEAKDIYQEAVINLWKKACSGEYTVKSRIGTYLYGVSINMWRRELSRKKKLSRQDKDIEHLEGQFSFNKTQDIENQDYVAIARHCLQQLGKTCRKILMYYYFDGMSMASIAEKLSLANTNTAKTKKYKCKKKLDEKVKLQYSQSDFIE